MHALSLSLCIPAGARAQFELLRNFREKVPSVVHFIKTDARRDNFHMVAFLAVRSASYHIKPDIIKVWRLTRRLIGCQTLQHCAANILTRISRSCRLPPFAPPVLVRRRTDRCAVAADAPRNARAEGRDWRAAALAEWRAAATRRAPIGRVAARNPDPRGASYQCLFSAMCLPLLSCCRSDKILTYTALTYCKIMNTFRIFHRVAST